MLIETNRFGKIEYDKSEIITMVRGLLGFDDCLRFIIVSLKGQEPFKWLQSLEDSGLAFLIMDPLYFKPDYIVEINPKDLSLIKAGRLEDVSIFVLVSIPRGKPHRMSANLQAPIAVNRKNMNAIQLVLGESEYIPDHSIFRELQDRLAEAASGENK